MTTIGKPPCDEGVIRSGKGEAPCPSTSGPWVLAATIIAAAIGPIVGGLLIDNVSWRAAFFLNIPLALIVLFISLKHVPESRDPDAARLDFTGAFLATLGLGGIVFGLIEAA